MGLPLAWAVIMSWLIATSPSCPPPPAEVGPKPLKFPNIPAREKYDIEADDDFWAEFPFNPLPKGPSTQIRVNRLELLVNKYSKYWSDYEKVIAERAMEILKHGAISYTVNSLPAIRARNSTSAILNGRQITDTIAFWVSQKYVSGPFDHPPLTGFRVNPLMAVIQPGKIRPVLNLSAPKGRSLNESLDPAKIPNIFMTTAKEFSYAILKCGFNAKMAKFDCDNAYKIVPSHPSAWRLHGFAWNQKYFVDTSSIFGSKAAPAHFDCIGFLLVLIAATTSKIPKNLVFRTLDDTPIVSPHNKNYCTDFARDYRKLCKFINVGLAPTDPNKEKAFENSTEGVVLGVYFNTKNLTWAIPSKKVSELMNLIFLIHSAPATHLKTLQQLMGKWESIAQMSPFAKGFRWPLLNFMKQFNDDEDVILPIPNSVKKDMQVWAAMAAAAAKGLPIAQPCNDPPLCHFSFASDAAGRRPPGSKDETGVAAIGFHNRKSWFGIQLKWKTEFTWVVQDNTAVYEMVGLLLPILTLYKQLKHQHVVLYVDNQAIIWAWPKRRMKKDALASVLIRTLHIMEAFIPCRIYVEHLPRVSNTVAKICDNLSRKSTTTPTDLAHLTHEEDDLPKPFLDWLAYPAENWNLGTEIVNYILKKQNK